MKQIFKKSLIVFILTLALFIQNLNFIKAEVEAENDLVKQYQKTVKDYHHQGLNDLIIKNDPEAIVSVILMINDDEETKSVDQNSEIDVDDRFLEMKKLRKAQHQRLLLEFSQMLEKDIAMVDEINVIANAMAFNIALKDLMVIAKHPEIEKIQSNDKFMPKPTGVLKTSNSGFRRARRSVYKGEGQVIAVIDSGFDVDHQDMRIEDPDSVAFNESQINAKIENFNLKGKYFNNKFPYGYNYADNNQNLIETAPFSHGTHVAGIAAGSGVYGSRSSEAQVLALRVFSDEFKGTEPTLYTKALEDAIILKAGIINMSLGASSAVLKDVNPLVDRALENAKRLGIVVNISAGNDSHSNSAVSPPKAENPNYATVGTPSIAKAAISIASINTLHRMLPVLKDGANNVYDYQPSAAVSLNDIYDREFELVDLKRAKDEDIATINPEDVKGKIAIIERGEITFFDKIENATKLGAVAAIIYNNPENEGSTFSMAGIENTTIPSIVVRRVHGLALKDNGRVTISKNIQAFTYDDAGKLSDFSSWGASPEFDLKPEITGVGGNVYAAQPNDSYANESGTSMAAPNVSAASALLNQRLNSDDSIHLPTSSDADDLTLLAILKKNLLMSTAIPQANQTSDNEPYASPRKQGAGVVDVEALLKTKAYVTAKATAEDPYPLSKVNLQNVSDTNISFTITLHNISKTETLSFKPKAVLTTDKLDALNPSYIIPVGSQKISDDFVGETISLAPNSTKDIIVNFDFSNNVERLKQAFINGFHVEGFVRLESLNKEVQPDIGLPFIGFYGVLKDGTRLRYTDLPVVEKPIYDFEDLSVDAPIYYYSEDSKEVSPFTSLLSGIGPYIVVLGDESSENEAVFNKDKIAISPNNDQNLDFIAFRGVFINHFIKAGIKIYDANNNLVYSGKELFDGSGSEEIGRRGDVTSGSPEALATRFQQHEEWLWDGQKAGAVAVSDNRYNLEDIAEDGRYRFEFHAQGIMEDSKVQTLSFDFYVDTKKPSFNASTYLSDTKNYQTTLTDLGSGIKKVELVKKDLEGNIIETKDIEIDQDNNINLNFKIEDNENPKDWYVIAYDYAANVSSKQLATFNNAYGKIVPIYENSETQAVINLDADDYTLEVRDSENRLVENIDELLYGTYHISLSIDTLEYLALVSEFDVVISAENPNQEVKFSLKTQEVFDVTLTPLIYPEIDQEVAEVYLLATNLATNQQTRFPIEILNALSTPTFDGKLTVGNWKFEVVNLPQEWKVSPLSFETEVSANGKLSHKPNIVLIKGESLKIRTNVRVVGDAVDPSLLQFEAYNGSIFFDDLSLLPKNDRYIVKPKNTPSGYVYFPDHILLEDINDLEVEANFTLTQLTEETKGKVSINTVMNPSTLNKIDVEYYAVDLDGNINFDIENLPFGTWYIKPLYFNKSYEADLQLQQVIIHEENKNPELTFTWSPLSAKDERHSLGIIVNHNPRRDGRKYKSLTDGKYQFEIENVETKEIIEVDAVPNEFNRVLVENLPVGYYKVTPKVADGYFSFQKYLYVLVDGSDNSNLSFIYLKNNPAYNYNPIHKIDSETKAEVIIPTYAPVNLEAFEFSVAKKEQALTIDNTLKQAVVYDLNIYNLGVLNAKTVLYHGMETFMNEKWTVKLLLEDSQEAEVYYLSKGGLGTVKLASTIEENEGHRYIVFEVDHFSEYALVFKETVDQPDNGNNVDDTTNNTLNIITNGNVQVEYNRNLFNTDIILRVVTLDEAIEGYKNEDVDLYDIDIIDEATNEKVNFNGSVKVKIEFDKNKTPIKVYYVGEQLEPLVYQEIRENDKAYVEFEATHFSKYAIVFKPTATSDNTTTIVIDNNKPKPDVVVVNTVNPTVINNTPKLPNTGANNNYQNLALVMFIIGAYLLKKKY